MKILGLINKESGPGFHRVMMPLLMMPGVDVHVTNSATPELIEQYDAIYYNRVIGSEAHLLAKSLNKKIIVDIDDYWKLDQHHISHDYYKEHDFESLQLYHIQHADLITTTQSRLAALIEPYHDNILICHNAIPQHEYFKTEKTESELPRIFWQGSITHEKDICLLKNPFKRLNNCATIIAGYTKHEVWGRMVNAFTNGLTLPGMVLPGLLPMEYYKNYSLADICVAPLVASRFNSMKSNLKVLEAANVSVPIVCSKVDPYLDLPVLYAESQKDWFKHLNMLIHDKAAREHYGKVLHDYCAEHYNYETINKIRYDGFLKTIGATKESVASIVL